MNPTIAEVKIPLESEGWAQGRNGMAKLGGIRLWIGTDQAFIEFVNSKGQTLNAGAGCKPEYLDELALSWLKARGLGAL